MLERETGIFKYFLVVSGPHILLDYGRAGVKLINCDGDHVEIP
jgi:hypothetical protein